MFWKNARANVHINVSLLAQGHVYHTAGLGQLINLIINFYKLTIKLINLT